MQAGVSVGKGLGWVRLLGDMEWGECRLWGKELGMVLTSLGDWRQCRLPVEQPGGGLCRFWGMLVIVDTLGGVVQTFRGWGEGWEQCRMSSQGVLSPPKFCGHCPSLTSGLCKWPPGSLPVRFVTEQWCRVACVHMCTCVTGIACVYVCVCMCVCLCACGEFPHLDVHM